MKKIRIEDDNTVFMMLKFLTPDLACLNPTFLKMTGASATLNATIPLSPVPTVSISCSFTLLISGSQQFCLLPTLASVNIRKHLLLSQLCRGS